MSCCALCKRTTLGLELAKHAEVYCMCLGHDIGPVQIWLRPKSIAEGLHIVTAVRGILSCEITLEGWKFVREEPLSPELTSEIVQQLERPVVESPELNGQRGTQEYIVSVVTRGTTMADLVLATIIVMLNALPGIETFASYPATETRPYQIWFQATELASLDRILSQSAKHGWRLAVYYPALLFLWESPIYPNAIPATPIDVQMARELLETLHSRESS